jgi:hypothetical protein
VATIEPLDGLKIGTEVGKFVVGLAAESERSAVVLGVARLDVGLETLLTRSMRHSLGGSDELFDTGKALSPFAVKILLAHRLGLIDDDVERVLQLVRRIRNSFAHSIETEKLSESAHKNRLLEISRVCQTSPLFKSMKDSFSAIPKLSQELATYCAVITTLITTLDIAAHIAQIPGIMSAATIDLKQVDSPRGREIGVAPSPSSLLDKK